MNNDIIKIGQNTLYGYFANLEEQHHLHTDVLIKNLKSLEASGFTASMLTDVIEKIADYITGISRIDRDQARSLHTILRRNIGSWAFAVRAYMNTDLKPEEGFSANRLLRIGHGLSRMAIHPGDDFVMDFYKMVRHMFRKGDIRRLSDKLKAAHVIGIFDALSGSDALRDLGKELVASADRHEMRPDHMNQSIRLAHYYGLEEHRQPFISDNEGLVSNAERALFDDFERVAGPIKVTRQVLIDEIGHFADGLLEYDDHKALIELDGPSHFIGRGVLNGKSWLMTELLARLRPEWTIIRLPYTVPSLWQFAPEGRDSAQRQFMEAALAGKSGTYIYSGIQKDFFSLRDTFALKNSRYTPAPRG